MTTKSKTEVPFDGGFVYFVATVAIAVILIYITGGRAVCMISGIVMYVLAEQFISRHLHSHRGIRTLLSLFFGSWLALAIWFIHKTLA
jgi:energy-converting hydrogenase Eha subunit G